MKTIIKNIAWAIRHPRYAACWIRRGLPDSAIHATLAIAAIAAMATGCVGQHTQIGNNISGTGTYMTLGIPITASEKIGAALAIGKFSVTTVIQATSTN